MNINMMIRKGHLEQIIADLETAVENGGSEALASLHSTLELLNGSDGKLTMRIGDVKRSKVELVPEN